MITKAEGGRWLPKAVVFDLDDTLISQSDWLKVAVDRIAVATARIGLVDEQVMRAAMLTTLSEGSDRPGVVDRALQLARPESTGPPEAGLVRVLVAEFMATRVPNLKCSPGARELLHALRDRDIRIGVLSDGRVETQLAKVEDAALTELVDAILITDSLGGREFRKPNPAGLQVLLERLGCDEPADVLVVGDRPSKDTAVAHAVGAAAWRVLTGEYASVPDEPAADRVLSSLWSVGDALEVLDAVSDAQR